MSTCARRVVRCARATGDGGWLVVVAEPTRRWDGTVLPPYAALVRAAGHAAVVLGEAVRVELKTRADLSTQRRVEATCRPATASSALPATKTSVILEIKKLPTVVERKLDAQERSCLVWQ